MPGTSINKEEIGLSLVYSMFLLRRASNHAGLCRGAKRLDLTRALGKQTLFWF